MIASRRWPRQQDCAMCGVSASVCRRPPASRCMQGWHKKGRERQRKISYDRMGADGAVATVGHDLAAAGLVRLNGFLRLIHHPDQCHTISQIAAHSGITSPSTYQDASVHVPVMYSTMFTFYYSSLYRLTTPRIRLVFGPSSPRPRPSE